MLTVLTTKKACVLLYLIYLSIPSRILQLLFAGMLLSTQTSGKLYLSNDQGEKEDILTEEVEQSPADNETSGARTKRRTFVTLSEICCQINFKIVPINWGCVKQKYFCLNLIDWECKRFSHACHSSIPEHGFSKCTPVYKYTKIHLKSGRKTLRTTIDCRCA